MVAKSSCLDLVTSGIPQGTVLGPLMILIYVNDIVDGTSSTLWLFADDCLLYRVIKLEVNTCQIQCDLNHLSQQAQTWQMKFNLTKCTVIKCTRSHSIISRDYIQDCVLETRIHSKYLGKILNKTLSWSSHISNTASRASKILNFLRHNLYKCSQ